MDFKSYAAQTDDQLDLLTGALLIARDAHPELDIAEQTRRLDALAEPLARRGVNELPAPLQARALADHLCVRSGFRGNREDYYDPRNSFLCDVIERKVGIPISLSIVFVEVAKRVGINARGVSFPGHFLVRVDREQEAVIIDPFSDGSLLVEADLRELLRRIGGKLVLRDEMLAATPVRHILGRMLMNLRGIYAERAAYPSLLLVLDRLIDLLPDATDELRDRGYLCAKLGAPAAAIADLNCYLSAFPHAGDVAEVRRFLAELEGARDKSLN
ncbi:MAG TPA: transglutaminase-like domain-containing protein [Polyangiaceae bacterium]